MKLIQIILILSLALEIGCVEVRSKNEEPAADATLADSTSPTSPTIAIAPQKVSVEALEKPNSYNVRLPLPVGTLGVQKKLVLASAETDAVWQSVTVDPGLRVLADNDVKAGQKYAYRFGKVVDGEMSYADQIQVQIPLDYEFTPGFRLAEDSAPVVIEGYERIFLPRQSTLTIGTHSVTLKGKILIADDSIIQTFAQGTTASSAQLHGRNGGKLILNFEKAMGHLRIEMRGENGMNGGAGAPYTSTASAGEGAPPPIARIGVPCYNSGAHPGNVGETGARGRPGTAGGNGGSSGLAILNINDSANLRFDTTIEAGLGGVGGVGGPGQIGGPSGVDCYEKPNGSKGPDGATGENGLAGHPGDAQTICLNSSTQNSKCY